MTQTTKVFHIILYSPETLTKAEEALKTAGFMVVVDYSVTNSPLNASCDEPKCRFYLNKVKSKHPNKRRKTWLAMNRLEQTWLGMWWCYVQHGSSEACIKKKNTFHIEWLYRSLIRFAKSMWSMMSEASFTWKSRDCFSIWFTWSKRQRRFLYIILHYNALVLFFIYRNLYNKVIY